MERPRGRTLSKVAQNAYRDGEDAVIMTTEDPTSEGVVRRFQGQLELATADFPGALLPGGDPG